jgi:hypothetical protein
MIKRYIAIYDFETLCDLIVQIIDDNSFSLNLKEGEIEFSFKYYISKGNRSTLEMELMLKPKEMDRNKSIEKLYELEELIHHVSNDHLSLIETKFRDLKIHLEKELKTDFMIQIDLLREDNNRFKFNLEKFNNKITNTNEQNSIINNKLKEEMVDFVKEENSGIKLILEEINKKINNTNEQIDMINNRLKNETPKVNEDFKREKNVEFLNLDLLHFNLSNSNRTIVKTDSYTCRGFMLNENIPQKGVYSFKFKIQYTDAKYIHVGIGLVTEDGSKGYYKKNCYMFDLNSPCLFNKGSRIELNSSFNPNIENGDIISVIVDMGSNECLYLIMEI